MESNEFQEYNENKEELLSIDLHFGGQSPLGKKNTLDLLSIDDFSSSSNSSKLKFSPNRPKSKGRLASRREEKPSLRKKKSVTSK